MYMFGLEHGYNGYMQVYIFRIYPTENYEYRNTSR